MKFNKILLFIVVATAINACGNKLDGKIEIRDKNKVYLINQSKTKVYKFTIKTTSTTNDTIKAYKTEFVELQPGDEKYIGNNKVEIQVPVIERWSYPPGIDTPKTPMVISYIDFSARVKKKYPEYKDVEDMLLTQKIIEKYPEYKNVVYFGDTIKTYSSNITVDIPTVVNNVKYDYEVTGQIELKFKYKSEK